MHIPTPIRRLLALVALAAGALALAPTAQAAHYPPSVCVVLRQYNRPIPAGECGAAATTTSQPTTSAPTTTSTTTLPTTTTAPFVCRANGVTGEPDCTTG